MINYFEILVDKMLIVGKKDLKILTFEITKRKFILIYVFSGNIIENKIF